MWEAGDEIVFPNRQLCGRADWLIFRLEVYGRNVGMRSQGAMRFKMISC